MNQKKILKNYIFNLTYQILAIITPLITTPYLSRVLKAENIGIFSYSLSITTYFILLGALGVGIYGQREIAYVQNDRDKRSTTFFEIFFMRFLTLSISMLIFYYTFCINGQYVVYYRILLLEIIANIIDISWYFQGLEEFKKTVSRNIIVKVCSLISIFIFVKEATDLHKYFIIYVLSNLFGNLSLWFYIPKYINISKIRRLNIFRHLKPAIILLIPQIANQIYTVLDKTMLGIMISCKSEVGYYEQSQKIIKLLITIATSLGTVMMPRIAATYAIGKKEEIKKYINNSFAYTMMIAFPLMMGLISIANNFVPIFFGEGYDKVATLLCILSPIIIFIGLSNVTGIQYLLPTKQQNKYTISVILGAIFNFTLNIILIKEFASIGASIASVIAEMIVAFAQLYFLRREIKVYDIIKVSYKYFIASIIMFASSVFITFFIYNKIVSIFIQISISILVYFFVLIIMKDKMILKGLNLMKEKAGKLKIK